MRKNLPDVPVQITIGRIPSGLADDIVDAGDGLSLKGRAVLLRSAAGLEHLLSSLDVNPAAADLILRAARLLEATSSPQPHTPQDLKVTDAAISRVAIESAVQDLDLDPQAAADVVRSITRAQRAVMARKAASEPGDAAKIGEGVL